MRKFTCLFIFLSVLLMLSAPLYAGTRDGDTPSEESVCDVLRDGEYTKGLYGLCVAYCEAEARSEKVLANYDRKRNEGDPEMPCTAPPECPCWTAGMVATSLANGTVLGCTIDEASEALLLDLETFGDFEVYAADSAGCSYMLDPDFTPNTGDEISFSAPYESASEEAVCRADIQTICDSMEP